MITKNVITKGKKVKLQTIDTKSGKTRTYPLGKTKVFFDVKVTKEGFSATAVARDGRVGTMNITVNRSGKVVGVVVDHPKVHMKVISTKKEVMLHVKKK